MAESIVEGGVAHASRTRSRRRGVHIDGDPVLLDGFLAGSDSVAAALVTRDGTILETNGYFARTLGPAETVLALVAPADGPAVSGLLTAAGPSWTSTQADVVRPDGEVLDCKVWVHSRGEDVLLLAEPLRTAAELLNSLLLEVNEDLLDARRDLYVKNQRLRELDALKSMFLASTTHDLKTPLTSILGFAELLGEQDLPAQARRMAVAIENNAHRVLAMVNDLLGAAQVMTGELQLERAPTDLVAIVRRALEAVEPAARRTRVTVTLHGLGSAPVVADERRVLQILDNLLSNAVKYSRDGGQVQVTCEHRAADVAVVVQDTGIGIPLEEQERLFERYFRASTATGRGIEGTGLGLANARSFAEAHGGSIECVSEVGVGSTFTLVLPRGLPARG